MSHLYSMDWFMLATDILVLMVMASMARYSYTFSVLSIKNRKEHSSDAITQLHFQDHAIAVIFASIGSTVGTFGAIYHIIEQDILRGDTYWAEIFTNTGFVLLTFSGLLFMRHMICEETPGHPYFIREYKIEPKRRKKESREIV